jgi:hypothetical protein
MPGQEVGLPLKGGLEEAEWQWKDLGGLQRGIRGARALRMFQCQ